MEQTKRRFGRLWWVTVTVALLLALVLAVETPLAAFAESANETEGKYIKEMIMITAKDIADAEAKVQKLNDDEKAAAKAVEDANALLDEKDRKPVPVPKTYYLFETPIYSHGDTVDATENLTQTYIAYTTTNNVKNSVKAIKPMYMYGGWSYEEYDKYLAKLESKTDFLAKDLYKAICEFATHLKAGKDNALYAKKVLDYLYEDDTEMYLPDFFVYLAEKGSYKYDEDHYALVKPELVTFLMQCNMNILSTVENALMIACKDSYVVADDDINFLTGMQRTEFLMGIDGYKKNKELPALFDPYVQDLLSSLPKVQEYINFYTKSNNMLEGDAEEMATRIESDTLNEEPQSLEEYFEIQEEIIEETKSGGSQKEKQAIAQVESFEVYYNRLEKEDQDRYTYGKIIYNSLKSCAYTGYSSDNYETLLDLFMKYEGTTEVISEQYKNEDFYPFLAKLSEGQRALLKVGLPQLFLSVMCPVEMMDNTFDGMLEGINESAETEEEKIKKDQPVSVYHDVDRSLYIKNNGIALTSEAIEATRSKPLAVVSNSETVKTVCNAIAIASACIYTVSAVTTMLGAAHVFNQVEAVRKVVEHFLDKGINVIETETGSVFGQEIVVTMTRSKVLTEPILQTVGGVSIIETGSEVPATFAQCFSRFLSMGLGIALKWIAGVSFAIMIISLIIEVIYPLIEEKMDEPYIDIPRVMCSYEQVYGQTGTDGKPVKDYIYYYGLKNPFLTEDDNTRANTRKGKVYKDTDILQFQIGDVANWTLKGPSRQWVALYYSTDSKAGKPVLANSLTVLADAGKFNNDAELIPVKQFHKNGPFDFNASYAVTKKADLPHVYLGYKCDNNAGATQSASVFSDITMWGGVIAGLILGGGIGTLVTYGIIRKRKKKMA